MRKIFGCCAIIVASSSLAFAQATAPAPVDLSYHFKAGTVLHYQRLDEIRNPDKPPGYKGRNFDTKDDLHITVENVDSLGNATLVIQNEETHDFKGGDDANGITMGALGQDIPLYRVTVDRYGNFINGKILHRSPQDSLAEVRSKDPNIWTSPRSDSATIKLWMRYALWPRPARTPVQDGMNWTDSSTRASHPIHMSLEHTSSASSERPDPNTPIVGHGYNAYHYDYSIDQNAESRKAGQYQLATETINYQVSEGQLISKGKEDEKQTIRSSDGLTTSLTELGRRIGGMGVDNSYMKRTLTLISIDSTAH
jgi:hypothetical protein